MGLHRGEGLLWSRCTRPHCLGMDGVCRGLCSRQAAQVMQAQYQQLLAQAAQQATQAQYQQLLAQAAQVMNQQAIAGLYNQGLANSGPGLGNPSGQQQMTPGLAAALALLGAVEPAPVRREDPQVGEVVGWRMWRVRGAGLISYVMDYAWRPGEPAVASGVDDWGVRGIWAFKDRRAAREHFRSLEIFASEPMVLGSVLMWGQVVECELGYRTEFAQVRGLDEAVPPFGGHYREINRRTWHLPWLGPYAAEQELEWLRKQYGVGASEVGDTDEAVP